MKAREMILVAALDCCHRGGPRFTRAELVLALHARFPKVYGLPGYRQWPDSNRVYSDLCRPPVRALFQAGLLSRGVGKGYMAITPDGRVEAAGIAAKLPATRSTAS